MAKVLLLVPPMTQDEAYASTAIAPGSCLPPLGLAYIAAFLRERRHNCEIIDGVAQPVGLKALCEHAQCFDVVGISVVTAYYLRAAELLSMLRDYPSRPPILVGGPHASNAPETLLRDGADVACIGEGEETVLELVQILTGQRHPGIDKECLRMVRGIAFIDGENDTLVRTKRRPPIIDLNSVPMPARDLLPMHLYRHTINKSKAMPTHTMFSSRGCTGVCSFCNHATFGRSIRRFSAQRVVDEFFVLRDKYGARGVNLPDDNFIQDPVYAINVCERLSSKKLDIPFNISARADSVTIEVLRALKKAGCLRIAVGFESGSQRILDNMKKQESIAQMKEAVAKIKKVGIRANGYFILGSPTETKEEIEQTITFAKELKLDYASFTLLVPFPGSLDYFRAKKSGRFDPLFYKKCIVSDYYSLRKPIYVPAGMTPDELLALHRYAYSSFFSSPYVILRNLVEIRSYKDVIRLVKGGGAILKNRFLK